MRALALAALAVLAALGRAGAGDATYRNPVLFGDYSDPDAVRAPDGFYLVASSFAAVPGLPILFSPDLVSWRLVGHALARLPSPDFDTPQHGKGVWAPSLRFHDGRYWIYWGDPDRGIFMTRARHPRGPWEPPVLVQEARGWIDPCPLWDDDGQAFLVHAWARSRAGFNGVLTLRRLTPDGRRLVGDGVTIFEGGSRHPTIEGPKLYKREGFYYVFAPAGGVERGWQTVLRSRSITGPYEDRVVLEQGPTPVNGPHQGAWVETAGGESWFLHFQDRGPYGRIVHLQPMTWRDGWPVIGDDPDGDGQGQPVPVAARPRGVTTGFDGGPQTGDEFEGPELGLQWQWQANPRSEWWSLAARRGALRLRAVASAGANGNLWQAGHLLLQKLPAEAFTATARLDPAGLKPGGQAGLVVMGASHASLTVRRGTGGLRLVAADRSDAEEGQAEDERAARALPEGAVELRLTVAPGAVCRFAFSRDGRTFEPIGAPFQAAAGRWVGAKVGLFALGAPATAAGHADVEWFRLQ